jgi:ribosome-associated protein YbcJ (S4-like RNA binding protein)
MLNVNAIKKAIESLPEKDFIQLRQWFSEKDWTKWDGQIEADVAAGKLDFLVNEALDEKREQKLKDL